MRTVPMFVVFFLLLAPCDNKDPETSGGRTTSAPPDSILLATFNIRVFSHASRDDQELEQIADILQRYDLVAIQELRDTVVLERTLAKLASRNLTYSTIASPPVGRGTSKERYAFLYRSDKVSVLGSGKLFADQADDFIREPYYATFRAGTFDFTLVTVHVLFGESEAGRRPEIVKLAEVFNAVQSEDPGEQDVILVGDFNFPPDDEGWQDLKAIESMRWLINPPEKTTIRDASLYDNFWFQSNVVREMTGTYGVYRFDESIYGNNDDLASRTVSDHRPVWAVFRTNLPDDD